MENRKSHWEKVYKDKRPDEMSWTQEVPAPSLNFIRSFELPKSAAIIDIGGGESKLADFLLDDGYKDITVLDISETALQRAKLRLGSRAGQINWIISDILAFKPARKYDLWHDRATFHFLTENDQIARYMATVRSSAKDYVVIGTFSTDGPERCSGLEVKRYNGRNIEKLFSPAFIRLRCIKEKHVTPFSTQQSFLFCGFRVRQPGNSI